MTTKTTNASYLGGAMHVNNRRVEFRLFSRESTRTEFPGTVSQGLSMAAALGLTLVRSSQGRMYFSPKK